MNNIIKALLSFAIVLTTSSCLDLEITDRYMKENMFQTEQHAIDALNGAYLPFEKASYIKQSQALLMGAYDDVLFSTLANSEHYSVSIDTHSAATSYTRNIWGVLYTGINNINTLLDHIDNIPFEQENNRAAIKAEALFLRAFYYFELVRLYGYEHGVPLRLTAVKNLGDSDIKQSPKEEVYKQIIEDLTYAVGDNEDGTSRLTVVPKTKGYVTKGAALTLLSTVYLTIEEWQNSIDCANDVLDLHQYILVDNYKDLWDVSKESQSQREYIFAIPYYRDPMNELGSGLSFVYNPDGLTPDSKPVTGTNDGKGAGNLKVHRWFIQFFQDDVDGLGYSDPQTSAAEENLSTKDYRIETTFWREYRYLNGNSVTPYPNVGGDVVQPNHGYISKYIDSEGTSSGTNENDASIFRLSDIYLNLAEAYNELNMREEAYAAINKLRERARKADGVERLYPMNATEGLSQKEFRWLVFMERGLEFAGESKRWYDLMRMKWDSNTLMYDYMRETYIPALIANDPSAFNSNYCRFSARKKTLPVPDTELTTNKLIKQNSGY